MPMPAEYHENHGNHENANFALGATQDASNMTANMYRVGGKVTVHISPVDGHASNLDAVSVINRRN